MIGTLCSLYLNYTNVPLDGLFNPSDQSFMYLTMLVFQ